MKKLLLFLLVGLLIGGSATIASANLIQNPGFEINNWPDSPSTFNSWVGGVWVDANKDDPHAGEYCALLGSESAVIYQDFSLPAPGEYVYGAWFKFSTYGHPSLDDGDFENDFGSAGINAKVNYGTVPDHNSTWVGIDSNLATSWTETNGWWTSDWYFMGGTFSVLPGFTSAQLRITLSAYEGLESAFRVDDAYVRPVPEPTTMLLLGTGLIGLAGFRRRFKK